MSISVFVVGLILGIMLSGCSSGSGAGSSGNAQKSQKSESATASGSAQASGESASSNSTSTASSSSKATSSGGGSAKKSGGRSKASASNSSTIPALAGVQSADRVAKKWHRDAKLYSIASLSPDVNASGRSTGWLYSYVSASAKAVVLVSVQGNEARIQQKPPVPKSQIKVISSHALPPPGRLVDSPQAIDRTKNVKKAIQQNPDARVSAGLDSFSSEDPVWIMTTIGKNGKRIEERVTATS